MCSPTGTFRAISFDLDTYSTTLSLTLTAAVPTPPGTDHTSWMVTPDEIGELSAVSVTSRLNGQVMQHATLDHLLFPLPVIIEYLSGFTTLNPGDVILTGTPGGVGAKREPPVWMKAGDLIEVEVSGVGTLKSIIADEA